jgi:rhodanese-related sulfurtransferase
MNKNLLVNCQVGLRGHTGSMLLKELGFNAVNLDGGYLTWINSPAGPTTKLS